MDQPFIKPVTVFALVATLFVGGTYAQSSASSLDRRALSIAQPVYPPYTELDVRNTEPPPRFEVTAPEGAPNVVIILIDDLGFGAPSTFGGPIPTPTLDQLANAGLRFNNFHNTALCSPTRVALKSGRNHHTANAGSIMETSTAYPGNTGAIPNRVAPLAEMLRLNGFSTAAFGKWHETWTNTIGDPELITVWTDPDFDAGQSAFYYARVLEIPTPRWTAYDAKRYGNKPLPGTRMTLQERAYTAPIWYTPEG